MLLRNQKNIKLGDFSSHFKASSTTVAGTDGTKEIKRRVEKIPGFEEKQMTKTAEADKKESEPLKAKVIDSAVIEEVGKKAENISKFECDEYVTLPLVSHG